MPSSRRSTARRAWTDEARAPPHRPRTGSSSVPCAIPLARARWRQGDGSSGPRRRGGPSVSGSLRAPGAPGDVDARPSLGARCTSRRRSTPETPHPGRADRPRSASPVGRDRSLRRCSRSERRTPSRRTSPPRRDGARTSPPSSATTKPAAGPVRSGSMPGVAHEASCRALGAALGGLRFGQSHSKMRSRGTGAPAAASAASSMRARSRSKLARGTGWPPRSTMNSPKPTMRSGSDPRRQAVSALGERRARTSPSGRARRPSSTSPPHAAASRSAVPGGPSRSVMALARRSGTSPRSLYRPQRVLEAKAVGDLERLGKRRSAGLRTRVGRRDEESGAGRPPPRRRLAGDRHGLLGEGRRLGRHAGPQRCPREV